MHSSTMLRNSNFMMPISSMFSRLGWWVTTHSRAFFVLVAVSRLLFLPVRVYLLFQFDLPSEFHFWREAMQLTDQRLYPFIHYWSEYPPIYPWLMMGLYWLSGWALSGQTAEVCFYSLMGLLLVAAELGVIVLLYKIAGLVGRSETAIETVPAESTMSYLRGADLGLCSAGIYVLLFFPGYLWMGWWDHLPVLLMLAALYWLLKDRERFTVGELGSAVLVGVGSLIKLFPILLLPVAICYLPTWRRKITYGLVVTAVVVAILLPFGLANLEMTRASFQNMFTRPSWETIWALMDGYYSYGIVAPLVERMNAATALIADHASPLPWGWVTMTFGLAFTAFYLWFGIWPMVGERLKSLLGRILPGSRPLSRSRQALRGRFSQREIVAALAFSVCLLLLYSKGYSPQYLTWIAPLVVILFPNWQGAAILGVLGVANLIELPVYISFFPDQHWILWLTVLVRTGLLAWLAWQFLRQTIPATGNGDR
jgi:hypothetical protein